jgi:serine/threonine-protein kinase
MSADQPTPEEVQFTALFAAAEEALACEEPAEAPFPAGTPSEMEARLQRDLACVHLLRRALRRPGPGEPEQLPGLPGPGGAPPARPPQPIELALVAGTGALRLTDEIQAVLRRRLLTIYLICAVLVALISGLFAVFWLRGTDSPLPPADAALAWSLVAVWGVLAAILHSSRPLSLRQLRVLELVGFGALTLANAWWTYEGFAGGELARCASLGGWGMMLLANAFSIKWFALIVIYGMFIPNTGRRCAAVVGSMALLPFALGAAAGFAAGTVPLSLLVAFLLQFGWWMALGAAVAVYGSHKISQHRQEAFAARQLGQYQLKQHLGSGGMGEVYLAEHVLLKQPCAVKLIRPERAGDTGILRRFEREVQATARLRHWNTVQIYDYGHAADGTFYYVMEYLPGPTLEQLVKRHGLLPPARAVHLLRQACAALREAHAMGLIHRDLKPANMMVCERGGIHDVLKLLDFGLVKAVGLDSWEEALTQQGAIAGTPAYMSPEQASGSEHLDARSDIYSLGAVAYFLLTGQPPFRRDKAIQLIVAQIHEPVRPPAELRPDVPADLQEVVLRCLEKDPARRFPEVTRLHEALAACACAGQWTEEGAARWWQAHACQGGDRARQPRDAPREREGPS